MHRSLVALLVGVTLLCLQLPGQETKPAESDAQAKAVIEKYITAREALKTGQFTATGTLEETVVNQGTRSGKVDIFCAVDFRDGKIRFDRTEPARPTVDGVQGGQYARTKDAVLVSRHDQDLVSILKPTRSAPSWARAFDVRTLGTAHQHDLNWGVTFERITEIYQKQPVHSVTESSSSLLRLEWQVQPEGRPLPVCQRFVWFDRNKDYWPIRMEMRECRSARKDDSSDSLTPIWSEIRETQQITVEKIEGTWVPTHVKFVSNGGMKKEELRLDWEIINGDVDQNLFTAEGFRREGVRQ